MMQSFPSNSKAHNQLIRFSRIGRGTFATVYMNTATPDVYKKCRSIDSCAALAEEYRHLKLISDAIQASGNQILSPTPIEFHDHDDVAVWDDPFFRFPECDAMKTCVYSMTRIYTLPGVLEEKPLVDLFWPPNLKEKGHNFIRRGNHLAPLLLRRPKLDVNQVSKAQRFSNTYNFHLTCGHAEQLGIDTALLSAEMGRMLAQFHMTARNDARGIKVVLGANITDDLNPQTRREHHAWVMDFDQVREFYFTEEQIPLLVDGFFTNEAYFPRARPADPHYNVFSKAYIEECGKVGEFAGQLGCKFVVKLEAEQARQDANRVWV